MFPKNSSFVPNQDSWLEVVGPKGPIGSISLKKDAKLVANLFVGKVSDYKPEYELYQPWIGKVPNGLYLEVQGPPSFSEITDDASGHLTCPSGLWKKEKEDLVQIIKE